MGRVQQMASLIKEGLNPFEIATECGLTLDSVLGYLDRAVGEGSLRRSDIYFSFPPDKREEHASYLAAYADAKLPLGDMYEDLRRIEVSLHALVQKTLVQRYGESDWWRQGVPESVRVKCQERRERDPDAPCEAYCYTDLFDLGKIIESQWALFKDELTSRYSSDRGCFRNDLKRLNGIRNKIMHPVRGAIPCEDDFYFVRKCERDFGLSQ